MAKYIALIAVTAAVTVAAYFGLSWYRTAMNTPERVIESFARDLTEEKAEHTYQRLSDRLKNEYSAEEWINETELFRKSSTKPVLLSQEAHADTFNAYPEESDPRRFTYKYSINGKDYVLSAVLYKQGNSWLVDEFQGDYR